MKRITRIFTLIHIAEIKAGSCEIEFAQLYHTISEYPFPLRQLAINVLGYSGLIPVRTFVLKQYAAYCEIIEIRAFGKTFSGLSPPLN